MRNPIITLALMIAALTAVSVGAWWERPSLGLIVPGATVFVLATMTIWNGQRKP